MARMLSEFAPIRIDQLRLPLFGLSFGELHLCLPQLVLRIDCILLLGIKQVGFDAVAAAVAYVHRLVIIAHFDFEKGFARLSSGRLDHGLRVAQPTL